jgi:3-hydroxy-D-aspartate aldolase
MPTYQQRAQAIASAADAVAETLRALAADKLECEVVSGAGTGTFAFEAASGVYNELQVGSYVFMDTEYARIGGAQGGLYTEFEHSLFVLASVISIPAADRAIVDAGLKSYTAERGPPWVHRRPDLEVTGVSDEHGKLTVAPNAQRLNLGEKLWLIPGHCDPTVNLHDWYVGIRNGRVETLWPIGARGASI